MLLDPEVEHHEQALTSEYEGLRRNFGDLRTSHDAIVKEKADLEKTEHEKVQQFQNSPCKKLAELRVDMEATVAELGGRCLHFPSANTIVIDFLESFWTEVQALPITFSECNENIT
jgi:ATP-dependent protease HslVU (ClpYQ) ATPase subunit